MWLIVWYNSDKLSNDYQFILHVERWTIGMPTSEDRLSTVEYSLDLFKTETLKAYRDMAFQITMVTGLSEDAVKRLATMRTQIDQRFDAVDQRLDAVDRRLDAIEKKLDHRLNMMEQKFDQMLQLHTPKTDQ